MARADLAQDEPFSRVAEQMMRGVPTSSFTTEHRPEILEAFRGRVGSVHGTGSVDAGLEQLVVYVASNAVGCRDSKHG